jgi:hypothetical protein
MDSNKIDFVLEDNQPTDITPANTSAPWQGARAAMGGQKTTVQNKNRPKKPAEPAQEKTRKSRT